MKTSLRGVLLSVLLGSVLGLTTRKAPIKHVVHERRDTSQSQWIQSGPLEPDRIIPARIGLKQSNLDLGASYLHEISDPQSPLYGQHYTAEEVTNLFAPSPDTVNKVKSWLISSGIPAQHISQSVNKAWLQFDASIADLENLLQTKFYYYESANGGRKHIACEHYRIPEELAAHIDYVTPGVKPLATTAMGDIFKRNLGTRSERLVQKRKEVPDDVLAKFKRDSGALDNCPDLITPACVKAMYNIPNGTLSNPANKLGVFAFGSVYSQKDIDIYYETFAPNIPAGTHPDLASIHGATAPTESNGKSPGKEAEMDFQLAYPIVWPQNIVDYQVDDSQWSFPGHPGIFNSFLDALDGSYCTYAYQNETGDNPTIDPVYASTQQECGIFTPTNVISISYGDIEDAYPVNYQIRQCNEFMKLALQGVTILAASGDIGVSNPHASCLGPQHNIFVPNYPSCPYVTLVGGTELPAGSTPAGPERAAVQFSSGGGFSNIFAQPSYQADAVNRFLTQHTPDFPSYASLNGTIGANGGLYNSIGRAYPDISAVSVHGAMVYYGGVPDQLADGTSMSTPIVAAIITRINEERIAVGKGPVGFINPTLYGNPGMSTDITVGDMARGTCGFPSHGFVCTEGWDPVTGLGTPRYDAWLKVFIALP